jgi:hypothetical protein
MKRSTLINAAYEIRLALKELGEYLDIHKLEYAPNLIKYSVYDKVNSHITAGLQMLSPDVTEEDDRDSLLKRIHGERPVSRLKSYLNQQKALLKDFLATKHQLTDKEIIQAQAHIATYDDCLKAVMNILEEVPITEGV